MEVETLFADAISSEASNDNEPVSVPIFNRDGEPYTNAEGKPASFQVLGEFSDKVRAFERRKRNPNMTGEEWLTARAIVALTGWDIAVNGKAVPFNTENAKVLLAAGPWLHQYVAQGMTNHSSFFVKKS